MKKGIKVLNIIFTILKVLCLALLIIIILALAMQRFSNNEMAVGGYRVFNVITESMVPTYQVGDVLIVKNINSNELKVGDDVTYIGKEGNFTGRIVTHRIIEIEETEDGNIFHTKGIANDVEDPTIKGDQIYGKVIYKCVVISLLTKLMNNMIAFYIFIFIPLGILVFLQIKDITESKKEEEDNE